MIAINTLTLPHASQRLHRLLVDNFGGYTKMVGSGEWYDPVKERSIWEFVTLYTIAFDPSVSADKFRTIAREEGIRQNQDVVFITIDGKGEFIDLRSPKISDQAA